MSLSSRFALDSGLIAGGAFLAVGSMAFSVPVAGWVGFGVSTGLAVAAGGGAVLARRTGQRIGHSVAALVGLWSLIAALVFSGTALTWLVLADGIALAVAAFADLTAHEVTTERVVHHLAVEQATDSRDVTDARLAA